MKQVHPIIRQGDVLLQRVGAISSLLREAPLDRDGSATLAHGEVTGHRHRFEFQANADGAALSTLYVHPVAAHEIARVQLGEPQALVHEEHFAHEISAGAWRVSRPYEYEGAELLRMVAD
jgi:hypothetical protein